MARTIPAGISPPHHLGGRVECYGIRIKQARDRAGLTQLELAYAAGVTPATVCRLERAKQTPHITTLARIADALGVTLEEVIG
jgi:transcriptional regulator with XRE-family HTH domain